MELGKPSARAPSDRATASWGPADETFGARRGALIPGYGQNTGRGSRPDCMAGNRARLPDHGAHPAPAGLFRIRRGDLRGRPLGGHQSHLAIDPATGPEGSAGRSSASRWMLASSALALGRQSGFELLAGKGGWEAPVAPRPADAVAAGAPDLAVGFSRVGDRFCPLYGCSRSTCRILAVARSAACIGGIARFAAPLAPRHPFPAVKFAPARQPGDRTSPLAARSAPRQPSPA
jgi:hypothetical protein